MSLFCQYSYENENERRIQEHKINLCQEKLNNKPDKLHIPHKSKKKQNLATPSSFKTVLDFTYRQMMKDNSAQVIDMPTIEMIESAVFLQFQ